MQPTCIRWYVPQVPKSLLGTLKSTIVSRETSLATGQPKLKVRYWMIVSQNLGSTLVGGNKLPLLSVFAQVPRRLEASRDLFDFAP